MKYLITGCSRGIGKALLIELLNNEHQVISISRTKTKIDNEITTPLIEWHEIVGSITDESVHKELAELLKAWRYLDVIINNAGYLVSKAFDSISYNDVKESFDVNFYGPLKMTQLALPYLLLSKRAAHINIGSVGGVQGSMKFPGLSVYSSSKGALATLSECLAEEYKESPIHFNCLALGAVQTEMLEEAFPGYQAPFNPQQMATFIINFIENNSPLMNGKIISVSASTP
jgi:3-oxoacyl-[acyl-carrier protein] reductase